MRNLLYSAIAVLTFLTVACSSDDSADNCVECTIALASVEICDNGDGTATVSAAGESEIIDLEGVDFDTFATGACALGGGLGLGF